ncbi:MAG: preprotein translocase subunit YajC [Muribaculaceae bacterium]|nr:preprotein translocase subunit YajC [Muribaculaceae bacterium]
MISNFILLQSTAGGDMGTIIMIVLLIVIFYFFMIRPQSQKQKKINEFRKGLSKGDKVMTAGGIQGRIVSIKEGQPFVSLEIAKDVVIRIDKNMIYESSQEVAEVGADPQNKN